MGLDGGANTAVSLIQRVGGERYFKSVRASSAGDHHARRCRGKLTRERVERRGADARRLRGRLHRHLSAEHPDDCHLAARPAIDLLICVETGKRSPRTDVDQSWSVLMIRTCLREIKLLRNHRPPAVEKIGAD